MRTTVGSNAAWAGRYAEPAIASIHTSSNTTTNGSPSANDAAASPLVRLLGSRDQTTVGVGVSYSFDVKIR